MQYVIKRDGSYEVFDETKIEKAILKAMDACKNRNEQLAKYIAYTVKIECMEDEDFINIEDLQDYVEQLLMNSDKKDVAKAYILYRENKTQKRKSQKNLMKIIGEKLTASNVQNQNANVDELSFGGRKGEAANELMKTYALENCMSEKAKRNHLENRIYIHDLDSYAVGQHNCLSIPFDDLLKNGFNTRQTDVRPANSINTAFQLLAVIFQIQSLQNFGGVSATHIDWTMVPYVRKSYYKHMRDAIKYVGNAVQQLYMDTFTDETPIDQYPFKDERLHRYAMDMTQKELKQAVEGMYHNLNTLQSRSGNQLPFSSINYGTCTSAEGRLVTKALLDGLISGVGKLHRTSIFPCGIFQYKKGINDKPGTPNYDLFRLALSATARRLYPNYANCDWSGNAGYDENDPRTYFSTMG